MGTGERQSLGEDTVVGDEAGFGGWLMGRDPATCPAISQSEMAI